ncbi:MAG: hypothetical protein WAV07_20950 [Candidatus Contendobacter sp.]
MLPIQEIQINTKNKRVFSVHLEKWAQDHFECKLAAINLGPQLPADATFGPFTKGVTALAAYQDLVSKLSTALTKLDATDAIAIVDNPCNTEFVTAREQKQVLGQSVVVKVNGVNA